MRDSAEGASRRGGSRNLRLENDHFSAQRSGSDGDLMTLAGLVVAIRARAKAQGDEAAPGGRGEGLGDLVAAAGALPAGPEAVAVASILAALARPEGAYRFDLGVLDVLRPTTIRAFDTLIGDMLEGHCSDQELRVAVRKVRVRRVK